MRARWQKTAPIFAGLSGSVLLLVLLAARLDAHPQGAAREFSIVGEHYAFAPRTITVDRDDVVKITFTAQDIAHSFTIDRYRISKRAGSGQSVTFEFRADQSGTFDYYCNLTLDAKCKEMKGQLIVH